MAKKPTVTTITSGYASNTQLNNNFTAIRNAFDNTLSLDGSSPNVMGADIDLNNNDLLNASVVNTATLKVGGVNVVPSAATALAVKQEFDTVADLLASTLTYSSFAPSDYIRVVDGGFVYQVAASSAFDQHLTTAGGVKLYVTPNGSKVFLSQFGAATVDDSAVFLKFISVIASWITDHVVVDRVVNLPGNNNSASLTAVQLPRPCTIEFVDGGRLLYSATGAVAHSYLKLNGVSGVKLIAPWVQNVPAATVRSGNHGILFIDCDDCHSFDARIEDVSGSGILTENSRRCTHTRPSVYRSLADGLHITNGSTGPSEDCWTFDGYTEDTGDDGFAIVSYNIGPATCKRCGHLDFVSIRSQARGATIAGGTACQLRGRVHNSEAQGVIIIEDTTYTSFPAIDCIVDVTAYSCVQTIAAVNAAITIGRGTKGLKGVVRTFDSLGRGVSVDGSGVAVSECALSIVDERSYGVGVHIVSLQNSLIASLQSNRAGESGVYITNSTSVSIGTVNIRDYGSRNVAVSRGLMVDGTSSIVTVDGGIIRDSLGFSERPILITSAVADVNIGQVQYGGGFAAIPLNAQAGAARITFPALSGSATYDPPSINAGASATTTVTVTSARAGDIVLGVQFDQNTSTQLTLTGEVTADNTVTVRLANNTASPVDLGSGTLRVVTQRILR